MKVRIVEWREYVPDCPADLEVTDESLLAVLAVDDQVEGLTQRAIDIYKAARVQEDYAEESSVFTFQYWADQGKPWSDEQKANHRASQAAEQLAAESDFEDHYGGFFNHNEYELGKLDNVYPQETTT